jgi:hypothetical protein
MTPAQRAVHADAWYRCAMLSEVMGLCASGMDAMDEKDAVTAGVSAFRLLGGIVREIASDLDKADRS